VVHVKLFSDRFCFRLFYRQMNVRVERSGQIIELTDQNLFLSVNSTDQQGIPEVLHLFRSLSSNCTVGCGLLCPNCTVKSNDGKRNRKCAKAKSCRICANVAQFSKKYSLNRQLCGNCSLAKSLCYLCEAQIPCDAETKDLGDVSQMLPPSHTPAVDIDSHGEHLLDTSTNNSEAENCKIVPTSTKPTTEQQVYLICLMRLSQLIYFFCFSVSLVSQ
jgi:hypothetical protein